MPVKKQDVHRALQLLEEYRRNLTDADSEELREALTKAIVAIRSRLFQALLDIHDFYSYTLESNAKTTETKTEETLHLAEKWENHPPPVPAETAQLAAKSLDTRVNSNTASNVQIETLHIHLQRGPTGGLGVSVAGGRDNPHVVDSSGIFVTKLIPGTPACNDGRLRLGDQIISVNGTDLEYVTHTDAVQTLKNSGKDVELVVQRRTEVSGTPSIENGERVVLDITLAKNDRGLGFSIAGGRGNAHVVGDDGVFVTKIIPGGVAEMQGDLATGDRILEVCGHKMDGLSHEEAVGVLKATPQTVELKVEKGALVKASHSPQESEADLQPQPERAVSLFRSNGEGLGFNIIGGEGDAGIFISYIAPGGVGDRSGGLRAGDHILKVNDESIGDANHDEAAKAFKQAGNHVQLLVRYDPVEFNRFQERLKQLNEVEDHGSPSKPSIQPEPEPVRQLYARALFDYDANKDDDRPSQGLSFSHGDILHLLNTGDNEWWQAALVGNHAEDGPQGLVPSKSRIERRALTGPRNVQFTSRNEQPHELEHRARASSEKEARRGLRSSFKLSRKLPFIKKADNSSGNEEEGREGDFVATYEPVTLEPRGYARPVIILGALKEDINDMLVHEFPDKFAGCVPHTTRTPREGEADGRDYHFVSSVEQMEKDIQAHLFIEAGRYKDNLYGTSIRAVQEVAQQGKHCILGVSGYAIRRLQMADLHPIAVCIRPSSVDVIQDVQPKTSGEQCQAIYEKGKRIEQEFAEFFTAVVDGDSLDGIYDKVKAVIHEQSGNYIWVPSTDTL
jgi:guanylate kinase/C-terminal processing protease CtpA/Prc